MNRGRHRERGSDRAPRPSFIAQIWRYRRYWRVDLVWAALLVAVSIVLSHHTLDLAMARWFFHRAPGGWPDATQQPWLALYHTPPIILAFIIPTCMCLLVLSALKRCPPRIRIRSIYLLLALWIGSGLIVEGIFKMNWGRPKPAQLAEFGGWLQFHAAHVPGMAGRGRSFPSGHSAVGFFLTAFYFLFRRDHPRRAAAALLGGLAMGGAIGWARMRVGGHFASDVAWSAAVMFTVNLLVYYAVLNVPAYEDACETSRHPRRPWGNIILLILIPALIQAAVMTLSPIYRSICHESPSGDTPDAVRIVTAGADLELTFTHHAPLRVAGALTGQGFAGATFDTTLRMSDAYGHRLADVLCTKRGWFFHSGGLLRARIPVDEVTRLTIDTDGGAIRITPHSVRPTQTVIDIPSGDLKASPFNAAAP